MSNIFLKKAVKTYATCALTLGLIMTSKIAILLALIAYGIHASIKT